MNESYATYLGIQYGPDVAARYRIIAASPTPLRFPSEGGTPKNTRPQIQICPECGKQFENRARKYCGKKCSKKSMRRRQREAAQKRSQLRKESG